MTGRVNNNPLWRSLANEKIRFTTLLLGATILEAAGYIAFPFLALRLRDQFEFSIEMAGLVMSIGIWLRPLASIFGAYLSGKIHGKWMFSIACLCESACFFLLGNARTPALAILGLMLGNVGFAIWAPNLFAIATDAGPKDLELSRLSKLNGFINSGAALGCVAGGLLVSIDSEFVFQMAGILYLGILLLLFPLVATWQARPVLAQNENIRSKNIVISQLALIKTATLTLLFWCSYGQFNTFFVMYAKDWLGSSAVTGTAFAVLAIGVSLFSSLLSKSIKLQGSLDLIVNFSLSGLAFGWGLLTLSPSLISAAIFILVLAIAETVLSVFLAQQWNRSFATAAGSSQGFHFAFRNIGLGLGGLAGGMFYYEPGHVSFYIFRQGHRALFIDSGLGLSNELGQSLLQHLGISEFVVYCTHTHCDHVGLNHMAKSVFLCRTEWEKYLRQNEVVQLQGYYSLLKDQKKWPPGIVINDSIREWKPSSFILDGDAFEFGPWRFRTFEVPGHTSGSLAFFELSQNNLFLGDMIYSGTLYFHLTDSSFGQYQYSLTRIKELIDKSDRPIGLWPSHNQIPLASDFLGDVESTIRAINKGAINHVRTWAKDAVFEEGVVYVDGLVKIVLRKDEYDGLQII